MSNQVKLFGVISLVVFVIILFVILSYKLIILDIKNKSLQEMMVDLAGYNAILKAENNFKKGNIKYYEYKPGVESAFLRHDKDEVEIWSYGFALADGNVDLDKIPEYEFLKVLDHRFILQYNQKMQFMIKRDKVERDIL
ncbi:MAG: hypothetical protein KAJ14_08695 [Candidatus Omnitrophica bacterium]|nr:hypothetical protein [Candidatus Omnitrophota bacterium]MCK5590681.1 hypothetical protein [Candidatus Paceibacterota bacterium]